MIGKKIIEYRKRHNINQVRMAELLNITKGMMSHIETGKRDASVSMIHELMKVTNTTWEFWQEDSEEIKYMKNRNNLNEINLLLDALIEANVINDAKDIKNEVFRNAILTALEADLQHKMEYKKFLNEVDNIEKR